MAAAPAYSHSPAAQIHQAQLLLQMEAPGADLEAGAPAGLLSAAHQVWTEAAKQVTISDFHRDVSATLRAMGIECALNPSITKPWTVSVPCAPRPLLPRGGHGRCRLCVPIN